MNPHLQIHPEVNAALQERRPVVALESTIISHGMKHPENIEMARAVETIIREAGATPATIAILHGRLMVGLDNEALTLLATDPSITKASIRDMPYIVATKTHGATTVASTMRIAALAGIAVFATGGIGGVHRGAASSMDVSADLTELATSNVAVVSAGIKSILDIGLTLEKLETLGVPVLTYGADEFPSFYSRQSGFKSPMRLNTPEEIAHLLHAKWSMGLEGGVSVANPIPAEDEIPASTIGLEIEKALRDMDAAGVTGKDTTPFLLRRIAEITGGSSLKANIALVKNNALLAAQIAVAYSPLV